MGSSAQCKSTGCPPRLLLLGLGFARWLGWEAGGNHHRGRRSARRFPVDADHGSPKPRQTMADPQAGRAPSAGGAPSGAGGAPFGSDDEDDEDEPMPRVVALQEDQRVSLRGRSRRRRGRRSSRAGVETATMQSRVVQRVDVMTAKKTTWSRTPPPRREPPALGSARPRDVVWCWHGARPPLHITRGAPVVLRA